MLGFRFGFTPAVSFFGRQLAPFFAQAGPLFGRQLPKAFSGFQQATLLPGRQFPEAPLPLLELFSLRRWKTVRARIPVSFEPPVILAPTFFPFLFSALTVGQPATLEGVSVTVEKGRAGDSRGVMRRQFRVLAGGLGSLRMGGSGMAGRQIGNWRRVLGQRSARDDRQQQTQGEAPPKVRQKCAHCLTPVPGPTGCWPARNKNPDARRVQGIRYSTERLGIPDGSVASVG